LKFAHAAALAVALFLTACASPGSGTAEQRDALLQESEAAKSRFRARDPGMARFFDESAGYAVFPSVGKGGLGVGGAYGHGTVYEGDALTGYTSLTQVTVGFQAGAQAYQEVIFFKDAAALSRFQRGNYEVGAQVSGVVVTLGASTTAEYNGGVVIFTMPRGGLMYEATVGGQKFSYRPLGAAASSPPPPPPAPPTAE